MLKKEEQEIFNLLRELEEKTLKVMGLRKHSSPPTYESASEAGVIKRAIGDIARALYANIGKRTTGMTLEQLVKQYVMDMHPNCDPKTIAFKVDFKRVYTEVEECEISTDGMKIEPEHGQMAMTAGKKGKRVYHEPIEEADDDDDHDD